jgi:creatinine amidohydrolase
MSDVDESTSWRAGHALLCERVERLPASLRAQAASGVPPLGIGPRTVRRFVTSGVGSSEAHARFLAHLLAAEHGLPARFVPLSALSAPPPREAERDVLVLFSQGLSPNARLPLAWPEAWRAVVLATAVTDAGAARPGQEARRRVLDRVSGAGGRIVRFPEEDELTTLVRVVGPMAGYLCALQLARALAGIPPAPAREVEEVEAICAALATAKARLDAARAERAAADLIRDLAFVTCGEYGELVANLRYKVLEGMLAPLPPVWDLLHFAHGPFQEVYDRPGVFLALTGRAVPGERDLLERMGRMLVPGRHTLVELRSDLPGALAIFDHEAMLDHLMLEVIEDLCIDQIRWPGRGLDAPLYDLGADR